MKINKLIFVIQFCFIILPNQVFAAFGDLVIENSSHTVSVQTWGSHAGAVVGLFWKYNTSLPPINFVNNYDHGRQIQMSLKLNDKCEAYNPTEAGSSNDGSGATTSSVLDDCRLESSNTLYTASYPAYWLAPGQSSNHCGHDCTQPGQATDYSSLQSNEVFYKRITVGIGEGDLQRIIKYEVSATAAGNYSHFDMEVPTGYLDKMFTKFYKYDCNTSNWCPMNTSQIGTTIYAEWVMDTILVCDNTENYCMGIWSPGSSMIGARYNIGSNDASETLKWAAYRYWENVTVGDTKSAVSYLVVGTKAEVQRIINNNFIPIVNQPVCTDNDGDDFAVEGGDCGAIDCNDTDAVVHPGATEITDDINNNCNGQTDENLPDDDLAIAAVTAPTTTAPGAVITVGHTTQNIGPNAVGSSNTKFYWSIIAEGDASDTLLGSQTIPSLTSSATYTGTISVTVPSNVLSGTFYIIAKADADNAIIETNEFNNAKSRSIRIVPDLDITATTGPLNAGAGQIITIGDTTKNNGPGAAVGSTTSFYLSNNILLDATDTLLGSRSVAPLAAGDSETGTISVTIPEGNANGTFFIIAKADADNAITEANELNNFKSRSLQIVPDLDVTATTGPLIAGAGQTITIGDTTKNNGPGAAVGSTTSFYLSNNIFLDATDTLLGSRSVAPLAAGDSETGTISVTIPEGNANGTFFIIAKADADNAITEANELNNAKNKFIILSDGLE